VAIAFANYNVYAQLAHLSSINQDLPLVNYVYAHNDLNTIQNQTAATVPIMALYDSLFGTYPFANEQYGHVQFSWGGGMEHQTMSFMVNFGYDLIAHELAHQWFGDQVTCANWKSIWLNESFATYTNLLCYDFLKTPSDFRQRIVQFQNDVMSAPNGAVFKQDTTDENQLFDYRTTYQKGAMVLHQLRWVLGDSIFFAGIRNYLADPLTRYRFADQNQLRSHFEALCNCPLKDYFDDWIIGEGYPNYHLIWRQSGTSLSIEVNQSNSMNNAIEYNVPIPVLIKGSHKDTLLVLPVNQLHQMHSFNLPFVVKDIECDPDHYLLGKFKVNGTYLTGPNVNVYPNPFSNHLYLWHEKESIQHWSIYAPNGQLVKQAQTDIMPGDVLDISFSDLTQGIYTIQFGNSNNIYTQKIVYIKP
jgi:aminopeptidase N